MSLLSNVVTTIPAKLISLHLQYVDHLLLAITFVINSLADIVAVVEVPPSLAYFTGKLPSHDGRAV